jgi:hypothetical protein
MLKARQYTLLGDRFASALHIRRYARIKTLILGRRGTVAAIDSNAARYSEEIHARAGAMHVMYPPRVHATCSIRMIESEL